MYKIFLLPLLVTFLAAANPKPYAALGDVIYNNVNRIESLKNISSYKLYKDEIDVYVKDVLATKKVGFTLEKKSATVSKNEYLMKLRTLSKKNDYYLRSVNTQYSNSMKTDDFGLFSEIINSGLINTDKYKEEIIDYYYKHEDDINSTGVIEDFLNADAKLKALKESQKKRYKTKKQKEAEKIARIRAKDKVTQKEIEKHLEEDLNEKKLEIRETQIKELSN